jgi:mono/diheme cytochrome c family protein
MRGTSWFVVLVGALVSLAAPAGAEIDKKVERAWKSKCASCHGTDGKGQTDTGKKMGVKDYTSPAWQKSKTDAQLKEVILNGVAAREVDGKKQEMDGYKGKLDEQIDGLVALIRGLK